jgi:hypothetical protein
MRNVLTIGIVVLLLAACFTLTQLINTERTRRSDEDEWLQGPWLIGLRGPRLPKLRDLTARGRVYWWLRSLCIALVFTSIVISQSAT